MLEAIFEQLCLKVSRDVDYFELRDWFDDQVGMASRRQGLSKGAVLDIILDHSNKTKIDKNEDIELVKDFVKDYKTTQLAQRRKGIKAQIAEASEGKVRLTREEIRAISLLQNRNRGKLYELMGLKLLLSNLFPESAEKEIEYSLDKKLFDSKDLDGRPSKRRMDIFFPEIRMGVEIKSGRIFNSKSIRNQIHKDAYLLKKNTLDEVWWLLFYGASKSVLHNLSASGIQYVDLALNDYG